MNGIAYIRVSSQEQVEGTSLQFQDDLCSRYCDQKGIQLLKVFRDEGESAKDLSLNNRTQFLAALEFCRKQKPRIDAFVVLRVDRFARNTEDHFAVRRMLASYGTTLHSVTEPIGNKPSEKFIETVLAGAADYDNAIRKQRCIDGSTARINEGIWPYRPPPGYLCAFHRKHDEKKTRPDAVDPETFPLVQRALLAYASGEITSQATLARQLNLWGFKMWTGKPATTQVVDRMLGKMLPYYAGILVNPWTKEERKGAHQPMISVQDMHRIRARRLGLAPDMPAQRSFFNADFPLRRLLKCPCGKFVTGTHAKGNGGRYGYYYCLNKECPLRSKVMRSNDIHTSFTKALRDLEATPETFKAVEAGVRALWASRRDRSSSAPADADKLTALRSRRARLFEMREDGTYDQDAFRERLRAVDAEIAMLTEATNTKQVTLADLDVEQVVNASQWLLEHLGEIWRQTTETTRPRFERVVFPDGISADLPAAVQTTKPGLIFALSEAFQQRLPPDVVFAGFSSNQEYEYFSELIEFHRECQNITKANEGETGKAAG